MAGEGRYNMCVLQPDCSLSGSIHFFVIPVVKILANYMLNILQKKLIKFQCGGLIRINYKVSGKYMALIRSTKKLLIALLRLIFIFFIGNPE